MNDFFLISTIQLFRERLSEKAHVTIPIGIAGSLLLLHFSISGKSEKNSTRRHGRMFASAKRKQQKQVGQPQYQEQCNDHMPITFRDCRVHFLSDNLSRNSCM